MELNDLSDEALAGLEQKLTRDLEMVRRVRAMLGEYRQGAKPAGPALAPAPVAVPMPMDPDAPAPLPPGFSFDTPQRVRKDMKARLLEAAAGFGKPFRIREIMAAADARNDRSGVRSALNRMVAGGELVIVSRGMGQNGHLYQLKPSDPLSAAGMTEPAALVTGNGSLASDVPQVA